MGNKFEFYDKPIMAYVSNGKHTPSIHEEPIIGKFTYYDNVRYISYDPIHRHFFTYKYAAINKPELPKKPRTIEDGLEVGDVIIHNNGGEFTIALAQNNIYTTTYKSDGIIRCGATYTLQEIIINKFKLKPVVEVKEEIQEMTVAEVSKALGKTIKIVE